MSSSSSLFSVQKPRAKRTLLPKSSLIQLFIDNTPHLDDLASRTNKTRLLPKLNDQDLLKQFNLAQPQPLHSEAQASPSHEQKTTRTPAASSSSPAQSSQAKSTASPSQFRKLIKENKFKQITRLCLYQSEQQQHEKSLNQDEKTKNLNETLELDLNQHKNRQNLLKHLSKEFLIDCKQRLDFNTFKMLLELLAKCKQQQQKEDLSNESMFKSNLDQLDLIYQIIRNDFNLCNKFSAFLTSEYAVHFNLFMQSTQYEKTYNLLQKLEIFIPNKCTLKKLVQSIQTTSELSLVESDQFKQIIDDVKLKISAATKNNQFIYDELEYLFDQRNANLEPVYEKINLTCESDRMSRLIDEEFIDLTQSSNLRLASSAASGNVNSNGKTTIKRNTKRKMS